MTTQPINNEPIKVIHGEYLDVPRWANKLFGKVLLHVPNSNTILKISGQFGTEKWSRIWWLFPPPVDLTGVWRANDGGTYYLRHVGFNVVEWYGRSFNNVFHGEIKCCNPDMRISGEWVDVPVLL